MINSAGAKTCELAESHSASRRGVRSFRFLADIFEDHEEEKYWFCATPTVHLVAVTQSVFSVFRAYMRNSGVETYFQTVVNMREEFIIAPRGGQYRVECSHFYRIQGDADYDATFEQTESTPFLCIFEYDLSRVPTEARAAFQAAFDRISEYYPLNTPYCDVTSQGDANENNETDIGFDIEHSDATGAALGAKLAFQRSDEWNIMFRNYYPPSDGQIDLRNVFRDSGGPHWGFTSPPTCWRHVLVNAIGKVRKALRNMHGELTNALARHSIQFKRIDDRNLDI